MTAPYIPSTDAAFLAWSVNFSDLITAAPATYGLVPADAVTIQSANDTYAAAQALVDAPSTKTVTTVAAKNSAKNAAIGIYRTYAQQIRNNPGVSNSDKLALGLNLPNNSPSPIPAPVTSPIVSIIGSTPGQHTLRFADSATPDKRSKPFGATALQIFRTIAVSVAADPDAALLVGTFTKQPFAVDYDSGDAGKISTMWGRWVTRTGLVGPWSASVSAVIPSV